MSIENSLSLFSKKYGIDTSDLFTKGKLIIKVDDDIEIDCIKANGYIYVSGVVMELPNNQHQRINILKDALKANFTLIDTERYILSIDKQHNQLLVTLAKSQQEIAEEEFEQMVMSVINNTEFFKKYLDKKNSSLVMPHLNHIIP
jgi:hypothetical protein